MPGTSLIVRTVERNFCGLALAGILLLSMIRYEKAIVAFCVGFCALFWRASRTSFVRHRGLVVASLALLAWIALLTWARDDRTSRILLVQYASYAALFLAVIAAMERFGHLAWNARLVLYFLLSLVTLAAVPESILYSDYLRVLQPFGEHGGRSSSIFNNPNNFGIFMAAGIGWTSSLWLERIIATRLVLISCAVFGAQIYLSGSRNAVATVAVVSLLVAIALVRRERSGLAGAEPGRAAGMAAAAVVSIAVAAVAAAAFAPDDIWGRSVAIPSGIRQVAWSEFARMIVERPLAGTSAAALLAGKTVAHGHNLLLTLAAEWGLVGLGLCFWWALRFARAATWTMARIVAVTPFLVGQVIDDFHYFRPFGILAAFVAAWCVSQPQMVAPIVLAPRLSEGAPDALRTES